MSYTLSKSRLQAHAQCPRRLWLSVHRRDLASTDEMAELVARRGDAFGAAARDLFPGGILVAEKDPREAVRITAEAMARFAAGTPPVPLFEAAFAVDDIVVRADILEPDASGGWVLVEVKSTVAKQGKPPKPHHVRDAAIQAWIIGRAGLRISRIEIGQPRGDFVLPHDLSTAGILARTDVTAEARALEAGIAGQADAARQVISLPGEPGREIGSHCDEPVACAFLEHCAGARPRTGEVLALPVWHLAASPRTKLVAGLMAAGHRDLAHLPEESLSTPMHRTMRAIATGAIPSPHVSPGLRDWMRARPWPRMVLDFETSDAPLPSWRGTRPGERVPFQFSLRKRLRAGGPTEHVEHLAETRDDPRPALARALADALEPGGAVIAWNGKSMEGPTIRALLPFCPERRDVLERAATSCAEHDPLPHFRAGFYDRRMAGSWSLKSIAAAVLPSSPHAGLRIANGVAAMKGYEEFLALPGGPARDRLRDDLLAYCGADTQAAQAICDMLEE